MRRCHPIRAVLRSMRCFFAMPDEEAETIISVEAQRLRHASVEEALAAFASFVKGPNEWRSALMKRRIVNESDLDWRIEAGQWILRAQTAGLEHWLQGRLLGARDLLVERIEENDAAHSKLLAELAPAMLVHYLSSTGWKLDGWEREQRPNEDIDVEMISPTGNTVAFQVKSTDKPGRWLGYKVLPNGELDDKLTFDDGSGASMVGRIVEGEQDAWVRAALSKAARQLPRPARQPSMIALCSQRRWPLGSSPRVIEPVLLGQPMLDPEVDTVPCLDMPRLAELEAEAIAAGREPDLRPGLFAGPWRHLGGVLTLDYRRGWDRFDYMCTVVLNPWADEIARCDPSWFPHARVLVLDGDKFRWIPRGFKPGDSKFRNGVRLIQATR